MDNKCTYLMSMFLPVHVHVRVIVYNMCVRAFRYNDV